MTTVTRGGYWAQLPSFLSSPDNKDDINNASEILFRSDTIGNHDVIELSYRGTTYLKYFTVDSDVYEKMVKPMQQAYLENTENEDIMSIAFSAFKNSCKNN